MDKNILGYACVGGDGLEYVMRRQCSDQLDRVTRKQGDQRINEWLTRFSELNHEKEGLLQSLEEQQVEIKRLRGMVVFPSENPNPEARRIKL
jgi:hypothetical protein